MILLLSRIVGRLRMRYVQILTIRHGNAWISVIVPSVRRMMIVRVAAHVKEAATAYSSYRKKALRAEMLLYL